VFVAKPGRPCKPCGPCAPVNPFGPVGPTSPVTPTAFPFSVNAPPVNCRIPPLIFIVLATSKPVVRILSVTSSFAIIESAITSLTINVEIFALRNSGVVSLAHACCDVTDIFYIKYLFSCAN
jgi:hypothetical protein